MSWNLCDVENMFISSPAIQLEMMMSYKNVDSNDDDDDVLDSRWGLAPPLPSPGDISFLRLPTCMSPLFNSGR